MSIAQQWRSDDRVCLVWELNVLILVLSEVAPRHVNLCDGSACPAFLTASVPALPSHHAPKQPVPHCAPYPRIQSPHLQPPMRLKLPSSK